MRLFATVAALAAGLALPALAWAEDPKTTADIRCVVVAYALTQNSDPDLQKLGTVSLFYFWGRLEGREATANIGHRLTEEASRMTPDDIKTQAKTCGDLFTAGSQNLQTLNNSVQDQAGSTPPPK